MADTILKLSADSGAQIRYTLDKSEPTQDSTLYSSQVSIPEGAVLKAKSFKSGYLPSDTMVYRNSFCNGIFTQESTLTENPGTCNWLIYNEDENCYYARFSTNSFFSKSTDLINWENLSPYNINNINSSYGFYPKMFYINKKYFICIYRNSNQTYFSVWVSDDLITWYEYQGTLSYVEDFSRFDVIYFKDAWVIGASQHSSSHLITTKDGKNFTRINNLGLTSNDYDTKKGTLSFAILNNKLFIFTRENLLYSTPDLSHWEGKILKSWLSIPSGYTQMSYTTMYSYGGYLIFAIICTNSNEEKIGIDIQLTNEDTSSFKKLNFINGGYGYSYYNNLYPYFCFVDGLGILNFYNPYYSSYLQNSYVLSNITEESLSVQCKLPVDMNISNGCSGVYNTLTHEYYILYNNIVYKLQQ